MQDIIDFQFETFLVCMSFWRLLHISFDYTGLCFGNYFCHRQILIGGICAIYATYHIYGNTLDIAHPQTYAHMLLYRELLV